MVDSVSSYQPVYGGNRRPLPPSKLEDSFGQQQRGAGDADKTGHTGHTGHTGTSHLGYRPIQQRCSRVTNAVTPRPRLLLVHTSAVCFVGDDAAC